MPNCAAGTIVAHEAWSSSGGEACLADLARGARRLAEPRIRRL
ncbi:MAG TPA: hypothetical protein VF650_13800 [Allosphingosinicella sp.]